MKRSADTPEHRIYRKDYRPPEWRVDKVDLEFDLTAAAGEGGQHPVQVRCRQKLSAVSGQPGPLVLDGRDMELVGIRIDGVELDSADWSLTPDTLTVTAFPASGELEIVGRIDPFANSSLEGLYGSPGLLCTQCESHGFSRITWFQDRPDVLSRYTVMILADPERYPVLLSNGNRVSESLENGRRKVVWDDPHPKPCYLFALVAGDLACVADSHRTPSGRDVAIEFWCDPGLEGQLGHAVQSLKHAMRFDEEVYGREYDLDLYMVVVARAFNMGAMENKGLNIFNPKCVLAHPETATDEDHVMVEAVVAHEYLHNWTGNRITCRDWFQLSLKEGLTVFREQEFTAAHAGGSAQRIHEVALLKARQYVEDAGPLAHPVRPESYVDMNNFYTATVYEKGAELIRVLRACVGEEGYAEGMQRYFTEFDGQAATIEDLVGCFEFTGGITSAEEFLRWYDRPGTPTLSISLQPAEQGCAVALRQQPAAVAKGHATDPVPVPVRLEFVDARGALPVVGHAGEAALLLNTPSAEYHFDFERPVEGELTPVYGGGLPAPIVWDCDYSNDALVQITRFATDPVARWEAQQGRYRAAVKQLMAGMSLPEDIFADVRGWFTPGADRAVLAELLTLPATATLMAEGQDVDPLAVAQAHQKVELVLAHAVWHDEQVVAGLLKVPEQWRFQEEDVAQRRLAVRLLELGLLAGRSHLRETVHQWLHESDNLSLRFGALAAAWKADLPDVSTLHDTLLGRHRRDELVLDRAFGLRARHATRDGLVTLLADPGYVRTSPNRVRAVMDTLVRQNPITFYDREGEALRIWAAEIIQLDAVNPQLTARLVGGLESAFRLAEPWRGQIFEVLEATQKRVRSPNTHEQLGRILQSAVD